MPTTKRKNDGSDWRDTVDDFAPPVDDGPPASNSNARPAPPVAVVDRPADDVIDLSAGVALADDTPRETAWDGRKTRLMLGYGMLRDQRYVPAGERVDFEASFHDGSWHGPEAGTVVTLMRSGHFVGTPAYAERRNAQVIIDNERGLNRLANDAQGPAPTGLHERTDAERRAVLDPMLRGGIKEMQRKERQEARTPAEESADQLAAAIVGAIKAGS